MSPARLLYLIARGRERRRRGGSPRGARGCQVRGHHRVASRCCLPTTLRPSCRRCRRAARGFPDGAAGEGGSRAGPVEDDAPPLSGRCCDSAQALGSHWVQGQRPDRLAGQLHPSAPATPGHRHRRAWAASHHVQRAGSVAEGLRSPEPETSSAGRAGPRRAPRLRPGRLRL